MPILVADDSMMARKILIRALPAGWEVDITQASNGVEALEACRAGKAHVMFLDLTMPVMDGYQLLEAVRKDGLEICVIVVSADVQALASTRVKELGAFGFIKKPVVAEELAAILKRGGII